MSLKRYAAMLLAALVVTAGAAGAVAAAPGSGNAPDDAGPNENANDAATDAADDGDGDASDASDANDASAADERRGPPTDMPEQVPDHVGEIHDLINQFIDGSVSDLGSAVSDVTPDDESDAANDSDASSTDSASETPA
ncbi:hypothetical protein BRD04_09770 [Halobacteriales archaeon QS_9_67_17]|nr:MAG: hypothetical protein BRD04_09770 [Halobacteriales archaeon QS_9_67_17]